MSFCDTTDVTFANLAASDAYGVTMTAGVSVFNSASTTTGSRTLGGVFRSAAYGRVDGGFTLTSTGEGLDGEGAYAVNLSYTADVGLATAGIGNYDTADTLSADVGSGGSLAGLASKTSASQGNGVLGTEAVILDGMASAAVTLTERWRIRTVLERTKAQGGLISDVVEISGLHLLDGHQADAFVLQVGYDPDELRAIWGENKAPYLAWLDPADGIWKNAVLGNYGGTPHGYGDTPWSAAGNFPLGSYGYHNGTVWAVVNHGSEFASVPEPDALTLLAVGLFFAAAFACRRRFAH